MSAIQHTMMPPLRSLSTATAASLLLLAHASEAQNCYYPNGDLSTTDAACSSDGVSACCPLNWDCLSNGLCYYKAENYYGRYTCTDQTWQSDSCPQFCQYESAADSSPGTGDQALLQDSDGDWCCDWNRDDSTPCTNQTDVVFFSLPPGRTIASISTLLPTASASSVSNGALATTQATPVSTAGGSQSAISSASSSTTKSSSSSTRSSGSSTTSSAQATTSSSTTTSAQTSVIPSSIVTTASNGAATTIETTIFQVSTPTTSSDPHLSSSSDDSSHSGNVGLIAGVATGVPAFLIASALIAFFYLKRRKSKQNTSAISSAHNESYNDDFEKKFGTQVGSFPPDGRAPELDSYPVASTSPKDGSSEGKSELEASRPSSGVSLLTAGGLHSPAKSQGQAGVSPVSNLHVVNEENEPAELWGGYVPYRPPQGGLPPIQQMGDGTIVHRYY